jgi:hypothetical protein
MSGRESRLVVTPGYTGDDDYARNLASIMRRHGIEGRDASRWTVVSEDYAGDDPYARDLARALRRARTAPPADAPVRLSFDERLAARWSEEIWETDSSDRAWFTVVRADSVSARVRDAADAGRAFACAHLEIDPPVMRFIRPETPSERAYRERWGPGDMPAFPMPDFNAFADLLERVIALRADLKPASAASSAAHECFHLSGRQDARHEPTATAYGRWAASALVRRGGRTARTVHRLPAAPGAHALANVAEEGDVAVARNGATARVFRTAGTRPRPRWLEHWNPCPITTGREEPA